MPAACSSQNTTSSQSLKRRYKRMFRFLLCLPHSDLVTSLPAAVKALPVSSATPWSPSPLGSPQLEQLHQPTTNVSYKAPLAPPVSSDRDSISSGNFLGMDGNLHGSSSSEGPGLGLVGEYCINRSRTLFHPAVGSASSDFQQLSVNGEGSGDEWDSGNDAAMSVGANSALALPTATITSDSSINSCKKGLIERWPRGLEISPVESDYRAVDGFGADSGGSSAGGAGGDVNINRGSGKCAHNTGSCGVHITTKVTHDTRYTTLHFAAGSAGGSFVGTTENVCSSTWAPVLAAASSGYGGYNAIAEMANCCGNSSSPHRFGRLQAPHASAPVPPDPLSPVPGEPQASIIPVTSEPRSRAGGAAAPASPSISSHSTNPFLLMMALADDDAHSKAQFQDVIAEYGNTCDTCYDSLEAISQVPSRIDGAASRETSSGWSVDLRVVSSSGFDVRTSHDVCHFATEVAIERSCVTLELGPISGFAAALPRSITYVGAKATGKSDPLQFCSHFTQILNDMEDAGSHQQPLIYSGHMKFSLEPDAAMATAHMQRGIDMDQEEHLPWRTSNLRNSAPAAVGQQAAVVQAQAVTHLEAVVMMAGPPPLQPSLPPTLSQQILPSPLPMPVPVLPVTRSMSRPSEIEVDDDAPN